MGGHTRGEIVSIARIIVAGNGPSAQTDVVRQWADTDAACVMRMNYFFLPDRDALNYRCTDWWVCQHDEGDLRACVAYMRGRSLGGCCDGTQITFWVPGLTERNMSPGECAERLGGADVRVQRLNANLPPACRWDCDMAPQRPLMGSFALAVAVGMQPDELWICGHDLFLHSSKQNQGGMKHDTRSWQKSFVAEYTCNIHRNHTLRGDLRYIGLALAAYRGHLTCCGSVLKQFFGAIYPQWTWLEG